MGRLRAAALRRFGSAVLVQSARHEAALAMLCRGGVRGIACAVERRAAVQARLVCLSGQAQPFTPSSMQGLSLHRPRLSSLVLRMRQECREGGSCSLSLMFGFLYL